MERIARRQGGAPTMIDVAALAGVSTMTVSRVINGETRVRAATRDAVASAIEALGFAPNRAAQSLAGAGPTRIGLLYSNPSSGYLNEFLVGSLDEASRFNIQLVVEKCEFGGQEVDVATRLIKAGIDGLILPPPLCDSEALIALLTSRGVTAVAVATARLSGPLSTVSVDDRQAAYDMTKHIIALGHRRIAFITGGETSSSSARRLDGYRAALKSAGIADVENLLASGYFTYRSGLDAAERLLDLADPPTAIFASNDDMAAATVSVAHRRGLDVPGDLTVCGYDDTALATAIWPELTTVRQPIANMSRAAIRQLVVEIKERRAGIKPTLQHLVQEFSLITRQSSANPRVTNAKQMAV